MKHNFLIIIAFFLFFSCRNNNTSITGNRPESSIRTVVLHNDAMELLMALNAGESIVGISEINETNFFYSSLKTLPRVGKWAEPNIEAIAQLKPDIVVTYDNWPAREELEDKLLPFGIKVERIPCYRIDQLANDARKLGELTGKTSEAEHFINYFQQYITLISERTKEISEIQTVYFEFGDYKALAPGSGSDEILEIARVKNAASEFQIPYPKISTEWLLSNNPDIIIKTIRSDIVKKEDYENLMQRQAWNTLDAIKENRVYLISSDICSGPRAVVGALYIAKWSYPERFEDIDPGEIHAKWLWEFFRKKPDRIYVYP